MGDFPPYDPDDEDDGYDGLSALDYSYPEHGSDHDSGLDALGGGYSAAADADDSGGYDGGDGYFEAVPVPDESGDHGSGLDALAEAEDDEELAVPLFTVTNPPGTVTVTTYMDGRVQQIELSPKAINMTEADLADEILVIADLAAQDARSAQYSFMLAGMREHGHDDVATRDFLTRNLDLPSPEQADETRAQVFSTRYGADHG